MKEVVVHVYDVTNSDSEKTNNTILKINRIFKDRIGIGGIFHTAVQEITEKEELYSIIFRESITWTPVEGNQKYKVYGDEEWSFGYCEYGSGVFSCPPTKNPMYTYRESIVLGETTFTNYMVNEIMWELRREWVGISYDLLSRNCNHFCDAFAERLGVPKLPAWVNRFANAGDAALVAAEITAVRLQQAKTEIVSASKLAYRFLASVASNSPGASPGTTGNSSSSISRFRASWFKDLVPAIAKPSPSTTHLIESSNSDNKPCLSLLKRTECTRSDLSSG